MEMKPEINMTVRPDLFQLKYNCMLEIYEYVDMKKEKRPDKKQAMDAYIAMLETNAELQSMYINELQAAAACLLISMNCGKPIEKHWDRLSTTIQKKSISVDCHKLIRKWYV